MSTTMNQIAEQE